MTYDRLLPTELQLVRISDLAAPYPIQARTMAAIAKKEHAPLAVRDFLTLFTPHTIFESAADFVNRSMKLRLLIHEERGMPVEYPRSPQD